MISGAIGEFARLSGNYHADRQSVSAQLTTFRAIPGTMNQSRSLARDFVALHAQSIYDDIEQQLGGPPSSPRALCAAADRLVPGLVPAAAVELDQAVVLQGILRDPVAGNRFLDAQRRPGPEAARLGQALDSTGRVQLTTVRIDRIGDVATVTMQNTTNLNAEDNQLVADLTRAVDAVMISTRARVGVLRGGTMTHPRYRGQRVFCAGINLKDLAAGRISYLDFLVGREVGLLSKLRRGLLIGGTPVTMPWIAAVDSFAIGGGTQLVLAVDYTIATVDAWFSLPAAREGIVPGVAALRLPVRVGEPLARAMIMGDKVLTSTQALTAGLCDEVVALGEMEAAVTRAASSLAVPAVAANKHMLTTAIEPLDAFRVFVAEFVLAQAERIHSADVRNNLEGGVNAGTC